MDDAIGKSVFTGDVSAANRNGTDEVYKKLPCDELGLGSLIWMFVGSTIAAPFVLFGLVVAAQLVQHVRRSSAEWESRKLVLANANETKHPPAVITGDLIARPSAKSPWDKLHESTQRLMTTKSFWGLFLDFVVVLASLCSYGVYLSEVSRVPYSGEQGNMTLEYCFVPSITHDARWLVDVVLNIFFVGYFLIRLTASNSKLHFILEVFSFVDYATIPPIFVAWYLNRSWTGLRFSRCLYLMHIPDLLQNIGVLQSRTSMRLAQLVSLICGCFLAAAGFFHLLENYGEHGQALSYWEFVYFCIVTAGTVGYGDISCRTAAGRFFNAIFIMSTLAVVASVLPELFRIISSRKKYGGTYESVGKRHIVVCGNVCVKTAQTFLKEFLHKDRGSYEIKVVFMDLKEPDSEWESLLKRHFADVEVECSGLEALQAAEWMLLTDPLLQYLQGTAMHGHDLSRAKAQQCQACIIVANKYCTDADAEDAANIMRVIAIKNFHSGTRVIVELMQYHNKAYLLNIPSWDWKNGDEVICLAELKLGLIAQSCIAPGFSTLMANLFTSRSTEKVPKDAPDDWRAEYLRGTGNEMYSEVFSSAFTNKTFAEVSTICFMDLDILLIAISYWEEAEQDHKMIINPTPSTIITADTMGFFIADSAEDVQRANTYCHACHHKVKDTKLIKRCACPKTSFVDRSDDAIAYEAMESPKKSVPFGRKNSVITNQEKVEIFIQNHPSTPRMTKRSFDMVLEPPNGPYLVVPLFPKYNAAAASESEDSLSESVREGTQAYEQLQEQAEESKFDSTGMFHWCIARPFDAVVIDRQAAAQKHFQQHVVIGIFADADSPLVGLNSLVMPLRSSNFKFEDLREVVVLGNVEYLSREWKNLYNFPKITIVKGSALSRADLRALNIHNCSMCVILTAKIPNSADQNLNGQRVIMASLNIKAMDFEPRTLSRLSRAPSTAGERTILGNQNPTKRRPRTGAKIPMITDLFNDPNVQYLDPEDDDLDDSANTGFFATEPFACGAAFTASVLDSLASMVYFNPSSFRVMRALIFGGASSELEEILAEGAGIIGGALISDADNRNRSFIGQIRMKDAPFNFHANSTFGDLFMDVLKEYGILCVGIFRLCWTPIPENT